MQHELGPFTVADWHALPPREDGSRLELIEGYWLVTPAPSGQHQFAEKRVVNLLDSAIESAPRAERQELTALNGIGVEVNTRNRTAIIPDFAVLNVPPIGNTFKPADVLLVGEIWSPGNSFIEQRGKFDGCERERIPFFWSIAQDEVGPVELVAYRLVGRRYEQEDHVKLGDGRLTITASPVPVEVDIAHLRYSRR
ncbi:Uma2 family endonuclease [Saccharopolyspora sp. NFXS83]|uniref:Uma2 family endonuclease n=1 Tax=Saccharopolyspora sp. NFXS83 TaxID=2993560 RepID=UPI00224A4E38|nr:Uma2 family endonuclease [Saccharopolyspora sp. NFXS83]MCX2730908.1 Uma2 family endonuclease [Saccharopolyspora sp. NFXS83]